MLGYDLLVYLGLAGIILVVWVAARVLATTEGDVGLPTRKIRFAAATFTGMLMLIIFVSILYFVDPTGPGKAIFDKVFNAITPLAGALIGYFFGAKE